MKFKNITPNDGRINNLINNSSSLLGLIAISVISVSSITAVKDFLLYNNFIKENKYE